MNDELVLELKLRRKKSSCSVWVCILCLSQVRESRVSSLREKRRLKRVADALDPSNPRKSNAKVSELHLTAKKHRCDRPSLLRTRLCLLHSDFRLLSNGDMVAKMDLTAWTSRISPRYLIHITSYPVCIPSAATS